MKNLFQARNVLAPVILTAILAGGIALLPCQADNHSPLQIAAATKAKPAAKATPKTVAKPTVAAAGNYQSINPLDLLKEPGVYLNKNITFDGTFNRFTDTGLDYKKAFRDARDYVGMMVYRPDVTSHKIPLSELKMFFPRKKSDDVQDLETGDTIRIKGNVFNTALGEPWVEVNEIKILQKTKDSKKKPGEECC